MKRFLGLCLLVVVICSAAFAKGHRQHTSARTKTEKEVVAFLDVLSEAGLKRDVATLERLYSDDYFHTNSDGSIMTKQQVMDYYKAPPTVITDSTKHDEAKVWVHGNVAFVNTRVTVKGRSQGNPYERQYRVTYLFEKTKDGWRCVTSHASAMPPPSS